MEKARINYTDEQTKYIVKEYLVCPERKTVEALAEELGRSIKSIIGKLSKEGVYRREGYRTKTGEVPITKAEIVISIAEELGLLEKDVEGLEKAPKRVLKNIETVLKYEG